MSFSKHRTRGHRSAASALWPLFLLGLSVASASASPATPDAAARDAEPFVAQDRQSRLIAALESAQAELSAASAAREEFAVVVVPAEPAVSVQTLKSKGARLLAVAVERTLGLGPSTLGALAGVLVLLLLAPMILRLVRSERVRSTIKKRGGLGRPRREPRAAAAAKPAQVPASGPPESNNEESVWGSILRLSASGMNGEQIARKLGASPEDVSLVLGLQKRRLEIAGALARAGDPA